MQTLLFVSTMTLGNEVQVREIHERFPVQALEGGVGVEQVTAFLGSGFYALQLTFDDSAGDFQTRYHQFVRTPEVQRFFDELRQHVDELPSPDDETGELHFAAPLLQWQRGMGA